MTSALLAQNYVADPDAVSLGLLVVRVCAGVAMAAHGYQKFFKGGKIDGTAGWFDSMGMRPGRFHATLAASTELGAGILFALGLFTPLAALAFVAAGGVQAGVRVLLVAPTTVTGLGLAMAELVTQSNDILESGVRLAAPAMLAGLVANIGVAMASRAAPSLNVFSVILAAMLIVGGFTLITTAPVFAQEMRLFGERAAQQMERVVGL